MRDVTIGLPRGVPGPAGTLSTASPAGHGGRGQPTTTRDMQQPASPPSRPPAEPGFLRRLARGGVWTTIDAWATEAANILVFLALVRLLAPSEFGIVAMATVFVALASDLGAFSLTHVLIQRKNLETGHVNAVFLIVMALSVLAFGVLVMAAPAITALYGQPEIERLLLWLSPVVVLNALTAVPIALLTREMQFARLAGRSFAMVAAGGAVGVGMAVLGFGPWALVGQQLVRSVVSIFALTLAADWRPSMKCSAKHLREVRTFVLNTFAERVITIADKRVVQFILGWLLGPAALGYYNVAAKLVEILLHLFTAPISQLVMPGFSRIQGDGPRVRSLLEGGVRLASLISYPAFVGTAVIAPLLVPVVLGEKWLPAVPVLALLSLRGIVSTLVVPGTSLVYALGRPEWMVRVGAVNLVANCVLLSVLAPFGVTAAATGELVRVFALHWPMTGSAIARLTGLTLWRQVRLLVPSLTASSVMGAAVWAWMSAIEHSSSVIALASSVAIGALVYVAVSFVFNRRLLRQGFALLNGGRSPAVQV